MADIVSISSGQPLARNEDVIAKLEELLELAKSGKGITGFAYAVIESAQEDCTTGWIGGDYSSYALGYAVSRLFHRYWEADDRR